MTAFCTPLPDFNSLAQLSPASPAQPPGTQPSLQPSLLYKLSPPDPFTDPQIQETKRRHGGRGGASVSALLSPLPQSQSQSLYKEKMGGQVPLTLQTEATLLIKAGRSHKPESYSLSPILL